MTMDPNTRQRGLLDMIGLQKMQQGAQGETGQRFYQRPSFGRFLQALGAGANQLTANPDPNYDRNIMAQRKAQFERRQMADQRQKVLELAKGYGPRIQALAATSPEQAMQIIGQLEAKRAMPKAVKAPSLPAAYEGLLLRAKAAGLEPGTPEYRQFMLSAGKGQGMNVVVGADGEVSVSTGGGYTGTGMSADEKRGYDVGQDVLGSKQRQLVKERTGDVQADVVSTNVAGALDILAPIGDDGQRQVKNKDWMQRTLSLDLPEAGAIGDFLQKLGPASSQEAVNLATLLDPIRANVAFDRLQQMREASKTGGALGNVSNVELAQLQASAGSLAQRASPEILVKNLMKIEEVYTKILNDPIANAMLYASTPEEFDRLAEESARLNKERNTELSDDELKRMYSK